MKIQQFQGGLSTRLEPQFLQQNEGIVYENIDNTKGILAPAKESVASGIFSLLFQTFFHQTGEWLSSDIRRDYVEYERSIFWTNRLTTPQRYAGAVQYDLGIVVPSQLTNFTLNQTDRVVSIEIRTIVGSQLPNTDLKYTIINSDTTVQSSALQLTVPQSGNILITADNTTEITESTEIDSSTGTRSIELKNPEGITIGLGNVEVYRLYQGKYHLVGTLNTPTATLIDGTLDISANKQLDKTLFYGLQGIYQYQMTYVSSVTDSESGPSFISAELDLTDSGSVTLNALPITTDPQVDTKKIYRIGGDLTSMTLVAEIAAGASTYTDNLKDTEVEGSLLTSEDALPPLLGIAYLATAYAMLFAAHSSKLYFTPIGKPDQWPADFFIQFETAISGIAAVANGILVFTQFKTFIVTGTGPTSLTPQILSADQGCLKFESVQVVSETAFWASSDGICSSSGGEVIVLSKHQLGKIAIDAADSVVHDEVYYVLETNGSILAFDFAYGKIFKRFDLGVQSLVVGSDILYGFNNKQLDQLFAGEDNLSIKYTSPRFIEGAISATKTYKNIHIYHNGDITIRVFINNILAIEKLLTGTDSSIIKLNQLNQRAFFIHFEIEGVGEVHEIEYIVGRRHNE